MDVNDILKLEGWANDWIPDVLDFYRPLNGVLQNNAHQTSAQPVAPPLDALVTHLRTVRTQELSTLQVRVLEALQVAHLLGPAGAYWVLKEVKASNYDPATTSDKISRAVTKLEQVLSVFEGFRTSVQKMGFSLVGDDELTDKFRIGLMFQAGASIKNLPDLKKYSADWSQIVSGISGAVGEAPEDTKVESVANGSILVYLTATAAVVKLFAVIAKHASEITSYGLDIANQLEDLRAKKMHNAAIEDQLREMGKAARTKSTDEALAEVEKVLDDELNPDQRAKLVNSINKFFAFKENGGDLDFSTPRTIVVDDEEFDEAAALEFNSVSDLIEEAQNAKQMVQLLELKQKNKLNDDG